MKYFSIYHRYYPHKDRMRQYGFIATIISSVAVGVGVTEGISALLTSGKNSQPAMPALPSMEAASSTAGTAQTQERKAALAASGQTNVTGGSGIVLGSDVQSLTLVGSA